MRNRLGHVRTSQEVIGFAGKRIACFSHSVHFLCSNWRWEQNPRFAQLAKTKLGMPKRINLDVGFVFEESHVKCVHYYLDYFLSMRNNWLMQIYRTTQADEVRRMCLRFSCGRDLVVWINRHTCSTLLVCNNKHFLLHHLGKLTKCDLWATYACTCDSLVMWVSNSVSKHFWPFDKCVCFPWPNRKTTSEIQLFFFRLVHSNHSQRRVRMINSQQYSMG